MYLPKRVTIKEVGPRDGLQNESEWIPTEKKIEWIDTISTTGIPYIEITSFVNPKWIPQLKDAEEVSEKIKRTSGVSYAALVPNMRGLETALTCNVDEVAIFMSATETHNLKNINKSITDTFPILGEVATATIQAGKKVRAYVSTVFGCPYEGKTDIDNVIRVTEKLLEMGAYEISLGDTIGIANPYQVEEVMSILNRHFKSETLALHFHNTRGMALANIVKGLEVGIETFDSSIGGIGGCPYAPGAAGNVATEDVLYMLHEMGIETNIDLEKVKNAAQQIEKSLGREVSSHFMKAEGRA